MNPPSVYEGPQTNYPGAPMATAHTDVGNPGGLPAPIGLDDEDDD